jgi:hypothetical protein
MLATASPYPWGRRHAGRDNEIYFERFSVAFNPERQRRFVTPSLGSAWRLGSAGPVAARPFRGVCVKVDECGGWRGLPGRAVVWAGALRSR